MTALFTRIWIDDELVLEDPKGLDRDAVMALIGLDLYSVVQTEGLTVEISSVYFFEGRLNVKVPGWEPFDPDAPRTPFPPFVERSNGDWSINGRMRGSDRFGVSGEILNTKFREPVGRPITYESRSERKARRLAKEPWYHQQHNKRHTK